MSKAHRERAIKAVQAREAKRRKDNQEQKETKLAMSPAEPSTKVKKQLPFNEAGRHE